MSTPNVHVDTPPYGLTVSPDGCNLYAVGFNSSETGDAIAQYTVGAGGMLSPMSPALLDAAGELPGGDRLQPVRPAPLRWWRGVHGRPRRWADQDRQDGPLKAFAPLQARREMASFTISNTPAGIPAFLDAEASTPTFGKITSYNWNFGGGTTQNRTLPDVGHVYEKPGKYTVTLEVTTAGDCSQPVYSARSSCATLARSGRRPVR